MVSERFFLYGSTEHLSGSPNTAVVRDLEVTHNQGPSLSGAHERVAEISEMRP